MKNVLEKQLNESKKIIESMPWADEVFYSNFLAQTYFFVQHSTRLLALSISYFDVQRDHLYKRFVTHLKEENYHEKIALADLEHLKKSIDQFQENSFTRSFWETQFYKIQQSKGTSLLGYILYLEAIAVHCFDQVFKEVEQLYGPKATRFIKVHVEEDPEHLDHAIELISTLNDKEREEIRINFTQSAQLYHAILLKELEKSQILKRVA